MKYLLLVIGLFLNTLGHATDIDSLLKKPNLRVLDIGNSFTEDATAYLSKLISSDGIDVSDMCLYAVIRASSSFKDWVNVYNDADKYDYSIRKIIGGLPINTTLGSYEPYDGSGLRSLLNNDEWDLILIHQRSLFANNYGQWTGTGNGGYLDELIGLIKEKQPQAAIGTYVIHSYSSDYALNSEHSDYLRWCNIANAVEQMTANYNIALVIPYGTAVQNLRESSYENERDLTRDGAHLAYGLPRYAASGCYYQAIFAPRYGTSFYGNKFRRYFEEDKDTVKYISITDKNAPVAQEAVMLAMSNWTICSNPEDETGTARVDSPARPSEDVYSLSGVRVYRKGDAPYGLRKGIYISGGKKWIVK